MAICKACIHQKVCVWHNELEDECNGNCADFKNKADVAEVKHGEWQRQKNGFYFLCSVCGKAAATKGNFCHNCGANMDKECE